jgi:esterase/lipase superfamily enzyme
MKRTRLFPILLAVALLTAVVFLLMQEPGEYEETRKPDVVRIEPGPPAQRHDEGWLVGTVHASDGTPLQQAIVTVTSETGAEQTTSTDESGQFQFPLTRGRYRAGVSYGNQNFSYENLDVRAGRPLQKSLDTTIESSAQRSARGARDHMDQLVAENRRLRLEASRDADVVIELPAPVSAEPVTTVEDVASAVSPYQQTTEELHDVPASSRPGDLESARGAEERRCKEKQPCRIEVFYATDRAELPVKMRSRRTKAFEIDFGGTRSRAGDPLTYGWADVTIPPHHEKGKGVVDLASDTYDVKTSVFVHNVIRASTEDEFIRRLRERIAQDPKKEMLVFVHGYKVSFFEAIRRTAEMHYSLGFEGAPALYSWPSGGSLWSYLGDEAATEWSAAHLRQFLDLLAARSGAERIHLVAHSMGSRPLMAALADIGRRSGNPSCPADETPTKFKQVVLAAPDMDSDIFAQLKDAVQNSVERVTIYASKRDRAILGSLILHKFDRLGRPIPPRPSGPKIQAVDASRAATSFLGHSYYGSSILWDVKRVIDLPAVPADERCTIVPARSPEAFAEFLPQYKKAPNAWQRAKHRLMFKGPLERIASKCNLEAARHDPSLSRGGER